MSGSEALSMNDIELTEESLETYFGHLYAAAKDHPVATSVLDAVAVPVVGMLLSALNAERAKVELLTSSQSRPAALEALAKAWDDGFKQGGPMHDENMDDPDAHTRNPYRNHA